MPFTYREFTISGSRDDTEGTAKFIQEAKLFMEEAGWTTFDDNTTAAGASHQLVMSSTGEGNDLPTFYVVLTSGSGGASTGQNLTHFQVANDWDAGAHSVPAGGLISPSTVSTNSTFNTRSQADYNVWLSGDSEGLAFITRQGTTTYDSVAFGRLNTFTSLDEDPYPLYVHTSPSSLVQVENTINVRGIAGNPPRILDANSEAEIIAIAFGSNNQPYQLGSVTSIFLAAPLVLMWDDGVPIRKGAIGTLRNAWAGAGSNAGMLAEGTLIASGTFGKQVYRAFLQASADSLIIRQE